MSEMPTKYDPKSSESRWYSEWVERGYFTADANSDKPPYCIVIPPPNVTGRLHMGHAFQQLLQDILVRRARMQGFEALWLPGTDHAGIATQVVVERNLREQGLDRREIGREAFVEKVWEWKEQYGNEIVEQMKAIGNSCDWSRLRFTMDEGLSLAVRVAFVRLHEQDLIYRGERLVNWCPSDHTGLSDSEVEYEEVDGELVTFRYPLSDGSGHIEVATTRLETMLGDTGIAVNPKDDRYRSLVGKTVRHPFDGREMPIIADMAVDLEFGTGAVKVTPSHDPNDWDIAARNDLPRINIFDQSAVLNENVPDRFRRLDRYEARDAVRGALSEAGLLVEEIRPYPHNVGHCYRCKSEVEPWVAGKQWFVKVGPLKEMARQAVKEGRIRFTPPRWARNYDVWLEGLRDWNISRQLWWGHRIPVWYCPEGHETVAVEDPAACLQCGSAALSQDEDVLDTWFSSQLWPFSTLGWPEDTKDLRKFYPTRVLVTGYEILYLWVARMVMSALFLVDGKATSNGETVPFEQVVIHGLVRDEHGRKMSKSIGNVLDPLDLLAEYGADALRFSLARMASPEQQNLPMAASSVETGRNFANKIWNASRLVLNAGGVAELPDTATLSSVERWLLSRHEACLREVDAALDADEYAEAMNALYRFLWTEYCDWGIELAKDRLYDGTAEQKSATANTLAWVLERTLRLLHPFMPFVTEEIWQRFDVGESIMVAEWPASIPELQDTASESEFALLRDVVTDIRQIQGGVPQEFGRNVAIDVELRSAIEPWVTDIKRLTGADSLFEPLEGVRVDLRIPDGVDTGDAVARLTRKLAEVDDKLERKRKKLANPGFLAKAAEQIVEKEQREVGELDEEAGRLRAQIVRLGG
jgi:valyl-tRNA synthetase